MNAQVPNNNISQNRLLVTFRESGDVARVESERYGRTCRGDVKDVSAIVLLLLP